MNLDKLFEAAAKEITGNYKIVISFNGKNRTFAYPGHKIRSLEAQLTKANTYTPKTIQTIIRSIMRIESNVARGLKIFGSNFKDGDVDYQITLDADGKQVVKELVNLYGENVNEEFKVTRICSQTGKKKTVKSGFSSKDEANNFIKSKGKEDKYKAEALDEAEAEYDKGQWSGDLTDKNGAYVKKLIQGLIHQKFGLKSIDGKNDGVSDIKMIASGASGGGGSYKVTFENPVKTKAGIVKSAVIHDSELQEYRKKMR